MQYESRQQYGQEIENDEECRRVGGREHIPIMPSVIPKIFQILSGDGKCLMGQFEPGSTYLSVDERQDVGRQAGRQVGRWVEEQSREQ